MANLLCYSRNRAASVEQIDETTLAATCRLQDSLTDAEVTLHLVLWLSNREGQLKKGRHAQPLA